MTITRILLTAAVTQPLRPRLWQGASAKGTDCDAEFTVDLKVLLEGIETLQTS
ncbi:hypothetical protein [Arthrobacter sp. Helios]|uniref:hypothetical protein n=1 Tax=Arthrobacter sp. Helios TaxID=2828862 RepID=UPI00206F4BD5|nr:hypothetical protein [Arthrobacter sp. Helios]UPO76402.1 hypothetical protein ArtHe_13760 [Arthrobacter sp. Helios]